DTVADRFRTEAYRRPRSRVARRAIARPAARSVRRPRRRRATEEWPPGARAIARGRSACTSFHARPPSLAERAPMVSWRDRATPRAPPRALRDARWFHWRHRARRRSV